LVVVVVVVVVVVAGGGGARRVCGKCQSVLLFAEKRAVQVGPAQLYLVPACPCHCTHAGAAGHPGTGQATGARQQRQGCVVSVGAHNKATTR
jgi:hypothetical protein